MKKGFTLKQLKKSILIIFAALFVTLPFVSAFAHPGRLDSNGGHWNHSTGEYHYHDGNSAGKSGSKNNDDISFSLFEKLSVSYGWGAWDIVHFILTFIIIGAYFYVFSNDLKSKELTSIISLVINSLVLIVFSLSLGFSNASGETFINTCVFGFVGTTIGSIFLLIVILQVVEKINDFIRWESEEKKQKAEEERKFQEEKNLMIKTYAGKPISDFVNIPNDSEIGEDNLPREKGSQKYWGDKYTFFVSLSGNKYHKSSCRYASFANPINAYKLSEYRSPCSFCNPRIPDMEWVDEYLKIKRIKEKYGINDFEDNPNIEIDYRNK